MSYATLNGLEEKYDRLKAFLHIDVNALEQDCANHSVLFLEASEVVADLKTQLGVAKLNLEQVQSATELEIREKYKGEKITEKTIASLVTMETKVQEKQQDIFDLEVHYYKWNNLMSAFDQRRSMLSNEVSLYTSNYFQCGEVKGKNQIIQEKIVRKRSEKAKNNGD